MLRVATLGILVAVVLAGVVPTAAVGATQAQDARALVRLAVDRMGGEKRLAGIRTIRIDGVGHRFLLEQSERPEGPFLVQYEQLSELRDVANGAFRQAFSTRGAQSDVWSEATLVVARHAAAVTRAGRTTAGTQSQVEDAELRLASGPERIVLAALSAPDLAAGPDETIQSTLQHSVAWTEGKTSYRLLVSADTGFPTAVEFVRAYPFSTFWNAWGDVTGRVYFSNWTLVPGGLRYPYQWDEERLGLAYRSFTVTNVTPNPPLTPEAFAIPAEVSASFKPGAATPVDAMPLGRGDKPASEIAPGVVQIPGWWNVEVVRQDDGVVVLEGPISSGYSAKVLDEVAKRFPGQPVKAVVTTSDSWPHLAGMREYAARGIPIYALDRNRPILERLLAAPHTSAPDALARAPRPPEFRAVSGKTTIGAGENRIELYPIRGEAGERMMAAYFPGRHLLYASDLVQKLPDGSYYSPEYLDEVVRLVGRERLEPTTVVAMHLTPTPWAEVPAAVAAAERGTPASK